jgi:spore maturation protein SpmA
MNKDKSSKPSVMNLVFVGFILVSVSCAAWNGSMEAITAASFNAARDAVFLAGKLIGVMALWLGLVKVLEEGGLMEALAKAVKPLMVRLFPDVPPEHPAMSAMVLNIAANMLGLGNAATPLGLKAMEELNKLNRIPGTATNAMCLFLAINTSSVTFLPLGAIGVRAAAGAAAPANIFVPTLVATCCSTAVAIAVALWLASRDREYLDDWHLRTAQGEDLIVEEQLRVRNQPPFGLLQWMVLLFIAAIGAGFFVHLWTGGMEFLSKDFASHWLMPLLMTAIVGYGVFRGLSVYEVVTDGAKQGFEIAVKIIPFLVAILVSIAMFRACGAMDLLSACLSPFTTLIGLPAEVLPLALLRPLSGSGAFGVMSELVQGAPDSYQAYVASTMLGSTETTFYVLAVYFGSIGVAKVRHAVMAGLAADITGVVVTSLVCQLFWAAS